jgi:hypothetical protein
MGRNKTIFKLYKERNHKDGVIHFYLDGEYFEKKTYDSPSRRKVYIEMFKRRIKFYNCFDNYYQIEPTIKNE